MIKSTGLASLSLNEQETSGATGTALVIAGRQATSHIQGLTLLSKRNGVWGAIKGITLVCNLDLMLPMHNVAHMPRAAKAVWVVVGLKGQSSGNHVSQQQPTVGVHIADERIQEQLPLRLLGSCIEGLAVSVQLRRSQTRTDASQWMGHNQSLHH